MEKTLTITDDSGFIGIANLSTYDAYIGQDWDFDSFKNRIVKEMKRNTILFWSTGHEAEWSVLITTHKEAQFPNPYRSEEALIEVTHSRLHLVNYETLTMAAQFNTVQLPEHHLKDQYIELENGTYLVEFGQIQNPEHNGAKEAVDFEIKLEKLENPSEYYPNDFEDIFWNNC